MALARGESLAPLESLKQDKSNLVSGKPRGFALSNGATNDRGRRARLLLTGLAIGTNTGQPALTQDCPLTDFVSQKAITRIIIVKSNMADTRR